MGIRDFFKRQSADTEASYTTYDEASSEDSDHVEQQRRTYTTAAYLPPDHRMNSDNCTCDACRNC